MVEVAEDEASREDGMKTASRLADQQPAPLESGRQELWAFERSGRDAVKTRIGVWTGDIVKARNFDVWVNPENTDMEMAHFHTASVSGIVRFLGARFSRRMGDSDDKIYRALLNEVSRKWGVSRPVPAGSAYITTSGQLRRTHGVKAIAHVACVEPRDAKAPGSGVRPVRDLDACARNVLIALDQNNRRSAKYRSVLFPLLATGMGGGDARAHSEIIVNAAADYVRSNPATAIEKISFLAFRPRDYDLFVAAIENLDGVRRI